LSQLLEARTKAEVEKIQAKTRAEAAVIACQTPKIPDK